MKKHKNKIIAGVIIAIPKATLSVKPTEAEQKVCEIPIKEANEPATKENKPENADNTPIYEGEGVLNMLAREVERNKIHMEFVNMPGYDSAYIEGIHNLYEFEFGEFSGWIYKVNDWFPNYGCSHYQLKEGNKVEWVYSCDSGVDVGRYYARVGE